MFDPYILKSSASRVAHWLLVCLFNLPLTLMLGMSAVTGQAVNAMWIVVSVILLITSYIVWRFPLIGTTWLWGGIFFVFLQFLPLFHVYVGLKAVSVAERFEPVTMLSPVSRDGYSQLHSWAGGSVATILTGGALLTGALVMGFIIMLLCVLANSLEQRYQDARFKSDRKHPSGELL